MTTRGFILGKFMPLHRGHLFLCRTAAEMVDELTVLVCSTPGEPIPGDLRFKWMQQSLPNARICHLHRDIPQEPEDDPDFWPIWKAAIAEHHPEPIDKVFASEPYVFRLAPELTAAPILVDPDRNLFPMSGAAIRKSPAGHWTDIAPAARPYFQKRLCILGPESTGKSRLTRDLAAHFKTLAMPEYGRTYDVHYKQGANGTGKGENWTEQDLIDLAETHIAMRNALAPQAGPLLIEDTDIIQTAIWAEFLLGRPSAKLERMTENAAHADHYFLLSPDVQWIDDGVRYAGAIDVRQWFFDAALSRLTALDLSHDIISGQRWPARREKAFDLADQHFSNSRRSD